MKKGILCFAGLLIYIRVFCWGFYMHEQINYHAVFLLPPQMMILYKQNIGFLTEHAVDPDKRRYVAASEGAHHFMDIDHYGISPFRDLPRSYKAAVDKFSADTLQAYGIVPWWIQTMLNRLTKAFREKDCRLILKYSAEIGHYIADAHVPLHACSNHNGQFTNQLGIHAFWESRIPELFAAKEWDFFIGKAVYIPDPGAFIWARLLESAAAADTVLRCEREANAHIRTDQKYAFEERKGMLVRQYSTAYARLYNEKLNDMVERRMRQSIFAVASFWYTAWVNAGQPSLDRLAHDSLTLAEQHEYKILNLEWKKGKVIGWDCDQ
ncbi:MAG: zinc dependent phospholipase C family protein [Bacteroidota bacterium]|nr:zinc dependent phospholipase C family protein [Bacteroidota bacterium]